MDGAGNLEKVRMETHYMEEIGRMGELILNSVQWSLSWFSVTVRGAYALDVCWFSGVALHWTDFQELLLSMSWLCSLFFYFRADSSPKCERGLSHAQRFTPEVGAVSVVSPARVLDLVDYSSSFDYDTSKDSLPPAPNLPLVSPFLCSDEYEGGTFPLAKHCGVAHEIPSTTSDFSCRTHVRLFPFGRPYRTHLNGPHSSSSSSSSDHSLSNGHTPQDTTNADSSTHTEEICSSITC
ncbi:hypothetical protein Tco_0894727 [Tanacetum coccineum]|uniref:Uncharacterized protein n=1 Tax=Tanacetum coccineum TaxID=301880 RepID=A0ABQ5CCI6_9ASTR